MSGAQDAIVDYSKGRLDWGDGDPCAHCGDPCEKCGKPFPLGQGNADPVRWEDVAVHLLNKSAEGCCGNDEWRGRYCHYHQGFEDGLDAIYEVIEDVATAHHIRERLANDNGTRYTLAEVVERLGIDPTLIDGLGAENNV